jgi:AraC family transcriptional regulator
MNDQERQDARGIEPIRFEDGKEMALAGLSVRYAMGAGTDLPGREGIPGQWQRFGAYLGRIPGQIGKIAYGACSGFDDRGNFDYLCGAEVRDFAGMPPELARLRVPAGLYAVFAHGEHISTVGDTWNAILNGWLPRSGFAGTGAPQIERYGDAFDPGTGLGGIEIWIPVRKR